MEPGIKPKQSHAESVVLTNTVFFNSVFKFKYIKYVYKYIYFITVLNLEQVDRGSNTY